MAQQTSQSSLLGKYGQKIAKAFDAHKGDETTASNFGELPAGIENGVAQVVECKFDVYKEGQNKGDVYFYAAAVVKLPVEHQGLPIEGLRTSIMEPVCDTPSRTRKTIDDHVKWILNQLRLMGVNTANMTLAHLEPAAAMVKKARPHVRFRTYKIAKKQPGQKGYNPQYDGPDAPEPRTNHDWMGTVDFKPTNGHSATGRPGQPVMQDDTEQSEVGDDQQAEPAAVAAPAASTRTTRRKAAPAPAPEPAEEQDQVFDDGAEDLDALAEAADGGDKEAKRKLTEMAQEAGCADEVADADDWKMGVELIRAAQGVTGSDEPAEEPAANDAPAGLAEGEVPELEQVWNYCPPDPKRKGQKLPSVECHVTKVSKTSETVTLKENKSGKEHLKVAWAELISA
jgi:hypothetical protein